MATKVLRPKDCLTIRHSPAAVVHCLKTTGLVEANNLLTRSARSVHGKPLSEQRKKLQPQQRRMPKRSAGDLVDKQHRYNNRNNLVVAEKVRVLKRGETLESIKADEKNGGQETRLNCLKTLAKNPKKIKNNVQVELQNLFAGFSVVASPSPRTLPVPSFLGKEGN